MPLVARLWHEMIPLTHMIRLVNEQSLKGLGIGGSFSSCGALLAIALFCGVLGGVRFSKRLEGEGASSELSLGGAA